MQCKLRASSSGNSGCMSSVDNDVRVVVVESVVVVVVVAADDDGDDGGGGVTMIVALPVFVSS